MHPEAHLYLHEARVAAAIRPGKPARAEHPPDPLRAVVAAQLRALANRLEPVPEPRRA